MVKKIVCKCGHNKSDHNIRRIKTEDIGFYSAHRDCEWKNCSCKRFEPQTTDSKKS